MIQSGLKLVASQAVQGHWVIFELLFEILNIINNHTKKTDQRRSSAKVNLTLHVAIILLSSENDLK